MSRLAAATILLIYSLAAFGQAPCPEPTNSGAIASTTWSYDVTLTDARRQLLHVRMTIAPTSPRLEVQLPVWNALYQVRDFAEHVNWLRATDSQGKPVATRKLDKTTWSAPNATSVEYEIAAIDAGPFGAEFTPNHAFLNLAQVLIYPVGVPKQVLHFQLRNVPDPWHVATPMNRDGKGFCAANYDQLVDSPVEAGKFHELGFGSDGADYRVIVDADAGDFDPEAIKKMLSGVVAAEVEWMQDRPFERYMFIYHFPKEFGRGGMEHAYSTAIEISTTRLSQDPLALASVSAHEFFHLWNVKQIRPQSLEPIDYTKENYTRTLWFSEGFTNTVGEYMLVRAGLADERTFLDRLASQIKTLETRPAISTQSAEESSLDAWLEKYPYYRAPERSVSYYGKGQILGVLLDLEMRRATSGTKSLRELFQWMNEHYAKKGRRFDDADGIREAAETVTGAKFDGFFRRFISGTEAIPYNDFFQTVGLKLERTQSTAADAGFTAATNFGPTPVVIATAPGGEADKANLHAGDSILAVNGVEPSANVVEQIAMMDPGSTVKLKVSSHNRTREVKYKLLAKQDFDFMFNEVPGATAEQLARRAAWIRGDSEGTR
jgi:predicted metalloprotease with PDZ domain